MFTQTIVATLVVAGLCAPVAHAQKKAPKPVVRPDMGFSYVPPRGYNAPERSPELPKNAFIMTGPRVAGGQGITTITMYKGPLGNGQMQPGVPSDAWVNDLLRPVVPDFLIANKARIKLDGADAIAIAGTFTHPAFRQVALRGRVLLAIHDDRVYLFAFGTDEERYDALVPTFTKMMTSLRWLNRPTPPVPATVTETSAGKP